MRPADRYFPSLHITLEGGPEMKEEIIEERQDKRHQKRFTRRCEVEFVSEGVTRRGISGNLSLTGLFIRTNHPPASDTTLDLLVFLPNETTSKLKVKVVRAYRTPTGKVMGTPVKHGTNGMGVRIIERDANYVHFFMSLLNYKTGHESTHAGVGKDAHQLLTAKDGKGLSPMEVVEALTKMVKQQQQSLDAHKETLEQQKKTLEALAAAVARLGF
jgi:hypothetical protein